jgi:DNA-binding IclR family transcriptional regulator
MSTGFAVRNKVQSLDRALEILKLLGTEPEMRVTDLARRLEVHKSTVFRLLATLEEHGLVEQNPRTEKYRLGYGLVRLAGSVVAEVDLARASRPVLEELALRTGETVNLAILQGNQVVNIDQIAAPNVVVNVNWVGKQTPLHATSNGKVLLAYLPNVERQRLLAAPLPRLTPRTITDARTLEKQLRRVVEDGYAFTLEELELGLNAVAAPGGGAHGRVQAAVSVAGPSYRVTPQRLGELGEMTRDAGEAISRRMGYIPAGGEA